MTKRDIWLLVALIAYAFGITLYTTGLCIEVKRLRALPKITDYSARVASLEDSYNTMKTSRDEWKKKYEQTVHPNWEEGQEMEEGT